MKRFHLIFFWVIAICMTVAGCRSAAVVQAPVAHHSDSVRIEYRWKTDSIFRDRWHTLIQKGDTIYKTDSIVDIRYQYLEIHDTARVVKSDTVTLIQEVEKPLTGGQQFLIRSGVACWILVLLVVFVGFVWLAIKIRKL